jgi:predicted porin
MKKSLLALAVTGAFAGAAQAQSSVTVYGLYDGGQNILKVKETSTAGAVTESQSGGFSGNASASSRIGFRGTETLSSDLNATFNLEYAITPGSGVLNTTGGTTAATNANASAAVRTSTVGLVSKSFGSVQIGRATTGVHGVVAGDVWGGNNMVGDMTYSSFSSTTTTSPQNITQVNDVAGRVSNMFTRLDNLVAYTTPTFMGANLRLDYANNTLTSDGYAGIQTALQGATLSYNWKQFTVKAATANTRYNEAQAASATFTGKKTTINAANAMFKQGPVTLQYTYAINKDETIITGAQNFKVRAQKLSASYQVTPQIMGFIQYGTGGTQMTNLASAANNQTNDTAMQIGAEYSMSKRTNLYAAYGSQERKRINTSAKAEMDQYAFGVRHTF